MLLSEVIGQEKLKQQLVQMVQHQRLSHAILFVGPEGSGALPLAVAFAQYIVSIPNNNESSGDLFGAQEPTTPKVYSPEEYAAAAGDYLGFFSLISYIILFFYINSKKIIACYACGNSGLIIK